MQEPHRHRSRFSKTTPLDYDQFKSRTIISLGKLGHQRFSAEPGGYSLKDWARGVNLLLDEFEERMGAAKLSPEYVENRRKLNECLARPVDLSSVENSISELKQHEDEIIRRIDEARATTASKIDELEDELTVRTAELDEVRKRISSAAAEEHSGLFLKRLFGRNRDSPSSASESKVDELESRLRSLPEEIAVQTRSLRAIDQRSSESPMAGEWKRLESLQVRLKELEDERTERLQLVREREEITASIAGAILRIQVNETSGEL